MAWSTSGVFRSVIGETLGGRRAIELGNALDATYGYDTGAANTATSLTVSLFNNTVTPDKNASYANSAYDAGAWLAGAQDGCTSTEWTAAGRPAVNPALSYVSPNIIMFDMDDTSSSAPTTVEDVYGALVHAASGDENGVCFNYFGGANSVTGGTLTIVWNANGLFRLTV
jgi:hypothetical protein